MPPFSIVPKARQHATPCDNYRRWLCTVNDHLTSRSRYAPQRCSHQAVLIFRPLHWRQLAKSGHAAFQVLQAGFSASRVVPGFRQDSFLAPFFQTCKILHRGSHLQDKPVSWLPKVAIGKRQKCGIWNEENKLRNDGGWSTCLITWPQLWCSLPHASRGQQSDKIIKMLMWKAFSAS